MPKLNYEKMRSLVKVLNKILDEMNEEMQLTDDAELAFAHIKTLKFSDLFIIRLEELILHDKD